ncbi:2-oxo-4-hydroxy-4-carboxy-5-ureidoimidazoline decarboxylase [Verrucomicrobium sp. BvORR106]|uniref:2-oxo-4-hydroxy-4-carboxy-5-ureidoimidazoline decarboxylase n=1 Tax=Verrucomicrobium sp. BvORR106 TaxID=1403819 RepID=UPI000570DC7D|nr:2-oxo-4-hydroxy-4-carboxy-5-ureidoimidazoline decarboxylase [Verrucomicrobium sp. BvORR106]
MPSLPELNTLPQDAFTAALAGLFEHSDWVAARTWALRPFASVEALHETMCTVMHEATEEEKLTLICAHPDLGDRLATLTPESASEQAAAGLNQLTAAEQARFHSLNAAYKARFGFPFILCARLNDAASMLSAFENRLPHDRDTEIATALAEIEKIARLRLERVF